MAKARTDGIAAIIGEVEALAKRLRADIRKRANAAGVEKTLKTAADRLRKRAAAAAEQIEKYVHEVRKELERGVKAPAPAKRAKAKPKPKAKPAPAAAAPHL